MRKILKTPIRMWKWRRVSSATNCFGINSPWARASRGRRKTGAKKKRKATRARKNQDANVKQNILYIFMFFHLWNIFPDVLVLLFPAGSDDSSDSDFMKSNSSSGSDLSEEVSGSEDDGKRRKTRYKERQPSNRQQTFTPERAEFIWTYCCFFLIWFRSSKKKDGEKQRSYKQQKKKRRRIKVQDSSSSNEKVSQTQTLVILSFHHQLLVISFGHT